MTREAFAFVRDVAPAPSLFDPDAPARSLLRLERREAQVKTVFGKRPLYCWCRLNRSAGSRATAGRNGIEEVGFGFVRHNERNETLGCDLDKEADELADIVTRSAPLGARLCCDGNRVRVESGK